MKYKNKMIILIILIILCLVLTILSMSLSVNFKYIDEVHFVEEGKVNYSVYLKDNDYFEEDYLPEGKQYIASLIEYVDANFLYTFDGYDENDYEYEYSITADLVAHEKNNPKEVLYEKEFILKDIQKIDNKNPFVINENVKINYDEYNSIINDFKSDYALSADSYLNVKLNVLWKAKNEIFNQKVEKENHINLMIPLSEQTINVNIDTKDINQDYAVQSTPKFHILNKIYFAAFIIFIIADVILIVTIIVSYLVERKNKGKYLLMIEKIEKQYDRAIVETNSLPENISNVIDVDSFEELLDARENIEKPILHLKEDLQSTFVIVDNDIMYRYIIKK